MARLRSSAVLRLLSSSPLVRHCALTSSTSTSTPRSDRDRHFLTALQVFYRLEGHFTVPAAFVVPTPADARASPWPQETHGMDLGLRLRLFTRGRSMPYKSAMLQSIGFPFADWRTYVWDQQLVPALRVFQALEGHLFVRQDFQVPLNDPRWPRAAWGVNLGSLCQVLRRDASSPRRDDDSERLAVDRRDVLNAMGFVWSDTQWKWETQFLKALARYRALYGHCDVHHTFRVPTMDHDKDGDRRTDFWPAAIVGYRLGHAVAKVRMSVQDDDQALTLEQVAELQDMGFFQPILSTLVWRNAVLPALRLYPRLYHGETCIPMDFVVPNDDLWPKPTRGMELGYIVHSIQWTCVFQMEVQDDRQELKEIGYTWEALVGKWAKDLVPALRWYKTTFGHCDVPSWYVVPMLIDASWPETLRGFPLGKQVVRVRRSGRENADVADVLMELDALGFKFNAFESNFVDRVLPALEVYAKMYGDTHVPQGFIVPSESTWPQPSWGTKLGHTVRNIRNRRQHAQQVEIYRERLENIGFVWSIYKSTAATKRDIADPCVEIYKKEHGENAEIPRNFVVPADDSRYPEVARSFELGAWLTQYNKRTNGLLPIQTQAGKKKAVATRHSSVERKLTPHAEQYWKDVLLCSFQVYAKLHGSCNDMDGNFVVPNENAYPRPAWGLNLGLRLRHLRYGVRYIKEIAKYKRELVDLGVLLHEGVGPLGFEGEKHTNREDGCRENEGFNGNKDLDDENECSDEEDHDGGDENVDEEDESEEDEHGTTGGDHSSKALLN